MKRIISILTVLVALTGQALGATNYGFSVGGVDVTSDNRTNITKTGVIFYRSGGRLYYVPSENTLYVKNISIKRTGSGNRGIYNNGCPGLKIVFEGVDTVYAQNSAAIRTDKNTTITCQNGGKCAIIGDKQDGLCPYSGSTITVNDADLYIAGTNSSAIEGNSSGSGGGNIVINNSKVQCYGSKASIYNMKSVIIKGSSNVHLTMRTSYVTVQNVASFSWLIPMEATTPSTGVWFDSSKKTLCSTNYPDGHRSTIIFTKTAIDVDATNFPDPTFRSWVSSNADTNGDSYLTKTERGNVIQIYVDNRGIGSLTGIEHFNNLNVLSCSGNNLQNIDITQNARLTTLFCEDNRLSSINVTKNPMLVLLCCYKNTNLSSLDVSKNTALQTLLCYKCNLSSLDVSKNTAIKQLHCYKNRLTSLTVSASNTAMTEIFAEQNQLRGTAMQTFVNNLPSVSSGTLRIRDGEGESSTTGNQMTVAQVQTATNKGWSVVEWWPSLGINKIYEGYDPGIAVNATNFPDATFRSWVSSNCDTDNNGYLSDTERAAKKSINVNSKNIESLQGIEFFTELTDLQCLNNKLMTIDFSKNTKLVSLECSNNRLVSMNLSKCTALKTVYCHDNRISGNLMTNFANGLPSVTNGKIYILWYESNTEKNTLTEEEVNIMKRKGWTVYCWEHHTEWAPYSKVIAEKMELKKDVTAIITTIIELDNQLKAKLPDPQASYYLDQLKAFKNHIAVIENELDIATTLAEVEQAQANILDFESRLYSFQSAIQPFLNGVSTGISDAARLNDKGKPRYNLNGQQVGTGYKGIVIENGKKVKR